MTLFRNDSPGALTLEQAIEIEMQREAHHRRRRQARELAAQGRGDDTEIAHVAPGEVVVPMRLQTPEVMAALYRAAQENDMPFEQLRVGSNANNINPNTGAPEFATNTGQPYYYDGPEIEGTTVSTPEDPETLRRARVIYGETASIYPQRIDPNKSIYDPNNWDPASADALANARSQIGVGSSRNDKTHSASPDMSNSLERQQWELALKSARASRGMDESFDPNAGRFYMWQKGTYQDGYVPQYDVLQSRGPFYTSPGGQYDKINRRYEVPAGSNLYIDFFKK